MAGENQGVYTHPKVAADGREIGCGTLARHAAGMQRRRSSSLLARVGSTKERARTRRGWRSQRRTWRDTRELGAAGTWQWRARPAGHGGRGHARRYSEGEREEASEGVGKKLGVHSELAGHAAGLTGTRGDRRRCSALHGRHEGKTSDTWCARWSPSSDAFFSIFPVVSDPWACTKVVVHKLLSNFY